MFYLLFKQEFVATLQEASLYLKPYQILYYSLVNLVIKLQVYLSFLLFISTLLVPFPVNFLYLKPTKSNNL